MMNRLVERMRATLAGLNGNQSGAIAFMVLCALLILMMMAWALYDGQQAARDAIDVQAAADAAAWSQTAVESRSMNTISFANVAKRIVFGTASYYQALWISFAEIFAIALVLTLACWVIDVFCLGCITSICTKLTEFTVEVGLMMVQELPDLITLETSLFNSHWLEDIKALDKYQEYMAALTPWWGWAEAFSRGSRNGATVAASWPPPKSLSLPTIPGIFGNTGRVDKLPVKRGTGDAWFTDLCMRAWGGGDVLVYLAEYYFKNYAFNTDNWKQFLAHTLAGAFAAAQFPAGCGIQYLVFGGDDAVQPWQIPTGYANSSWLRDTSTIVFTYKPDLDRMSDGDRQKYMYISKGDDSVPFLYAGGGSLAFARAEISYQNGAPDLWHTSWSARMRPVALPGEWSGLSTNETLVNAWHDVLGYIAIGAVLNTAIQTVASGLGGGGGSGSDGDDFDFDALLSAALGDFLMAEGAFGAMTHDNIEGLPK